MTNPRATVDPDGVTVRRTIRIHASRERVWRAVTDPAQISLWLAPTELSASVPGATGAVTFEGYGRIPLRVLAIDEPRSVTFAWNNDDAGVLPSEFDAARATEFTFTLEPDGDQTVLTVVESGFERTSDPAENTRAHAIGWTEELDELVALVEGAA